MMKAFDADLPEFADDPDEDTIELELTPSDMLALSRLAGEQPASTHPAEAKPTPAEAASVVENARLSPAEVAPVVKSARLSPAEAAPVVKSARLSPTQAAPVVKNSHTGNATRINRWPLARIAGLLSIAAAVIALGSAAHRAVDRNPPAPAIAIKASGSAAPAAPLLTESDSQPVRFKNPFDRSEVFEFPPGTSDAEARQEVANLLLQRAHERQSQLRGTRRVGRTGAGSARPAASTDHREDTARAVR
ncbi:MAG: hypothetical protein JWN85_3254 [Gammaproteobacteria bacterium]|nr:hypothetical protein [Gammaproteobacteria bacterium]